MSYCHYTIEKDGRYRTAVMPVGAKKIGDIIVIEDVDWIVTKVGGMQLSEQIYRDYLKYDDKHFYTTSKTIVKEVKNEEINDGKQYHEVFTYDNGFVLDTWYEDYSYVGVLTHPKDKTVNEKLTSPTMFEPLVGRDAWDFGVLFNLAEEYMEKYRMGAR